MQRWALALVVACFLPQADGVDPALRVAVERFYATQQAEDMAGYLALWSSSADRPRPEQLKYIFDAGDDKFSGLTITAVRPQGQQTVVRVTVNRERTIRRPDGSPIVFRTAMLAALTYVREENEWKLLREGSPVDALADALIAAPDVVAREQSLAEEPELVGPLLVSAVSRQAASAAQRGVYPRAQVIYELALDLARRIGDKKLQADTLQNIGNALYYQRNFAGAKPVYEEFLTIERELGNEDGIATALVGLGTAQYTQFEYTDAFASFREALAIQEKLNDSAGVATTLINTGNVQFLEGDFAGAAADYRRSRALYRASSDTLGETRALDGLGRTLVAQGDLTAALDAFTGVLEEGRSRNVPGLQGGALLSLGDLHVRLGNLDLARGLFDQGRAQFERIRDLPNVGRAWQAMGRTELLSGRFAAAEDAFTRSAAACTTGGDPECVAHATVGGAFAQSLQQHHSQAIGSYQQAIALFTALTKREDTARAEIGLSQALTGSGDYADALAVARHADTEGTAIGVDDVVWRARLANARAQRRLADTAAALTAARDAVRQVERMSQRAFDGVADLPPSDSSSAYALLAVLQAEGNDAAAAFNTIERQRVHSLRLTLARNERDIARGMTLPERDAERQLAVDVVTVRAQFDHEKALPKPNAARMERLQQQLNAAVETRARQRQELFSRMPQLRVWRGLEPAIGLDEAVKTLDQGEALVEFAIDDEDLLVLVAVHTADGPDCRAYLSSITRQTLAEHVAHAVEPATLRDLSLWRQASAELMQSIPTGAWSAISSATKAILIPDDVLWRVPFEAVTAGDGVLADRTVVLYAGSATSLASIPSTASPLPPASMVAVTAPEIPGPARERLQVTAPGWMVRPAEAAERETEQIAALFDEPPATILSRSSATEPAVREQIGKAAIVHIAAPFRINGASPLFSSIMLTPVSGPESTADNDGILEAREVMNLELHGALAVFSDGTSASMRSAASAVDVVSWSWRAAGIRAIALPRWATEDEATALLKGVYRGIAVKGESPEAALCAAATEIRAVEATRAPYYWAAWQVVGR